MSQPHEGRPEQLDALIHALQMELLQSKAHLERRRSRLVRETGTANGGEGETATIGDLMEWIESHDAPVPVQRLLIKFHQNVFVTSSRLIAMLRKIPLDVLRAWSRSGVLVDDYNVPERQLRIARACGSLERIWDQMDEMNKLKLEQLLPLIEHGDFEIILGRRNGAMEVRVSVDSSPRPVVMDTGPSSQSA